MVWPVFVRVNHGRQFIGEGFKRYCVLCVLSQFSCMLRSLTSFLLLRVTSSCIKTYWEVAIAAMMVAVSTFETSVSFYQTTRCDIPAAVRT